MHRGSAAHGDYVFGWEGDTLQKAMDNQCNLNTDCPKAGITAQPESVYSACTMAQQAPESVDGCKSKNHYLAPYSLFHPVPFHVLLVAQKARERC